MWVNNISSLIHFLLFLFSIFLKLFFSFCSFFENSYRGHQIWIFFNENRCLQVWPENILLWRPIVLFSSSDSSFHSICWRKVRSESWLEMASSDFPLYHLILFFFYLSLQVSNLYNEIKEAQKKIITRSGQKYLGDCSPKTFFDGFSYHWIWPTYFPLTLPSSSIPKITLKMGTISKPGAANDHGVWPEHFAGEISLAMTLLLRFLFHFLSPFPLLISSSATQNSKGNSSKDHQKTHENPSFSNTIVEHYVVI